MLCSLRISCNRDIVECKSGIMVTDYKDFLRCNRDIVECKSETSIPNIRFTLVVIETLWNVNIGGYPQGQVGSQL